MKKRDHKWRAFFATFVRNISKRGLILGNISDLSMKKLNILANNVANNVPIKEIS